MPELPEVETARAVIQRSALRRRIAAVDDTDSYVCRPHRPGEIAATLVGRMLTAAHRQGKTMWCQTSGVGRSRTPGPHLGLHLGMGGVIVVTGPHGVDRGGDPWPRSAAGKAVWNRFTLEFSDGGSLVLFDKRRLARARLEPDLDALGPDAQGIGRADFGAVMSTSKAPVKARLLDQSRIAGVGNLLADEVLWQARINPATRADQLAKTAVDRLYRALGPAIESAIEHGGVHTGEVIPARVKGGHCPRCGAEMRHGTVGGRSTWWCSAEQRRGREV